MANCQFKTIRENTLKSDKIKETHARQVQLNPYGGQVGMKNIKFEMLKKLNDLNQIVPARQAQEFTDDNEEEEEEKKKKKKPKKPSKKKMKDLLQNDGLASEASCDLTQTYNPPKPPQQPPVIK